MYRCAVKFPYHRFHIAQRKKATLHRIAFFPLSRLVAEFSSFIASELYSDIGSAEILIRRIPVCSNQ